MGEVRERHKWDNEVEFLMSCIATTVGLGNVWRFPFVAYSNGGGAFLIPYIIVLIVVGKPFYYMECILGQFSSRNSINVWSLCPALKGTGYCQALAVLYILSYYLVIVAICMYYLVHSFMPQLPWASCDEGWENCVPSDITLFKGKIPANASSSAELYYLRKVIQFKSTIHDGLGYPIWYLCVSLLIAWLLTFAIMARGVKSSGKAAYFLALFPYLVMIVLFITTMTLPGAGKGVLFFVKPEWRKLYTLKVWYSAITQVFFSLSVCQGAIIMFASYNSFTHNVYRDAIIITSLDTLTSLMSGFTIFGILGNLAKALNKGVGEVIGAGGASLAFISYPDAISKTFQPQLFSVLFFLMMTVLGIGSAVALMSTINAVMLDAFPKIRTVFLSAICCSTGFALGLVYVTPGGQYILELVDHYGGTFLAVLGAISEIIACMWIYGVENVCEDIEFMTKRKTSPYWRVCWVIIIPVMLIIIFCYAMDSYDAVKYANYEYPKEAHAAGYLLMIFGGLCLPVFMAAAFWKYRGGGWKAVRSNDLLDAADEHRRRPTCLWIHRRGWTHRALSEPICVRRWISISLATNGVNGGNDGEFVNVAFDSDGNTETQTKQDIEKSGDALKKPKLLNEDRSKERPKWDNQIEFLMSCIATSVGLGNVWRFPFVAYQNGGGAFLIPYIIVLLVIGKPMYFLETVLGQFSSSNCVKIWALSPAMKGTGYAQALGACYVLSYYVSIIALCLYYLAMSFNSTLPWALCDPAWEQFDRCVPSGQPASPEMQGNLTSSAELYFTQTVLRQSDGIHDGIGAPLWDLTLCLLASWIIIFVIVARGVKSSGKAAYFLAIFPYIIMFILLIRAVTLPGASKGILFFLTPEWSKILEIRVWYAAVTQVFFSLSVCSGALIMFASYNNLSQNVYRDSMIVTTLDTFTSLISGITIFGVLGNLAEQLNYDDVGQVIGSGGTSLAFISYPDAIAQSPFSPQLFAVLFFLMMAVLGVGSGVALLSTVNTILLDAFPRVPTVYMSAMACTAGFAIGLIYVTPGGQYILELVDYYGGTFMRLFAAIAETIGVFWIYGLENICLDIEYMLNMKTSIYWRVCWAIVTPVIMIAVFMYAIITTEALVFGGDGGYVYPRGAYIAGNCLQYFGMALIPLFIIITMWKYRTGNFVETAKVSFRKKPTYGPRDEEKREEWRTFRQDAKFTQNLKRKNWFHHIALSLFGGYRRKI